MLLSQVHCPNTSQWLDPPLELGIPPRSLPWVTRIGPPEPLPAVPRVCSDRETGSGVGVETETQTLQIWVPGILVCVLAARPSTGP